MIYHPENSRISQYTRWLFRPIPGLSFSSTHIPDQKLVLVYQFKIQNWLIEVSSLLAFFMRHVSETGPVAEPQSMLNLRNDIDIYLDKTNFVNQFIRSNPTLSLLVWG